MPPPPSIGPVKVEVKIAVMPLGFATVARGQLGENFSPCPVQTVVSLQARF